MSGNKPKLLGGEIKDHLFVIKVSVHSHFSGHLLHLLTAIGLEEVVENLEAAGPPC